MKTLKLKNGVQIDGVDGPAARAGLQRGDIVLRVGDTDITNAKQFADVTAQLDPQKAVAVLVRRGDNTQFARAAAPEVTRRCSCFYGRGWCHQRRHARRTGAGGAEFGVAVDYVDIDTDAALVARYDEDVPVLLLDGAEVCRHRFDDARVRDALSSRRRADLPRASVVSHGLGPAGAPRRPPPGPA